VREREREREGGWGDVTRLTNRTWTRLGYILSEHHFVVISGRKRVCVQLIHGI